MREVLAVALQIFAGIALPAWIVRRDIARLAEPELSRSWPDASLWSAVVGFGPLCIPIHFVRTRRSWTGVALGLAWLAATFGATLAVAWLVDPA